MLQSKDSGSLTDMILNIMARILDPGKQMKSKFYNGPVNGSTKGWNVAKNSGTSGFPDNMAKSESGNSVHSTSARELLDSRFLARLIEILQSSSPNLQRKAASILEFFAADEAQTEKFIISNIASALDAVFSQESLNDIGPDNDGQRPEFVLEIEEVGSAISATSRLFTRLLDFQQFRESIDTPHFTKLLRRHLKSSIPLHYKDWIAACVVKISSSFGSSSDTDNPINQEVTLYETIPRLIEQIEMSLSAEVQEAAVVELNRIISEGVVDSTRAVGSQGGIFPLVKLIENGTDRAMEAGLAILYNLSMDSENHAAIIAAGAIPILRRIALSKNSQWMRALHVLRTLPT